MLATKIISIVLASMLFLFAIWVGLKTNLLRESGSSNTVSPYSFSRFQLWLWSCVICPLFILNWGYVSPYEPNLNSTCLVLLGISVTGTLASRLITSAHEAAIKNSETGNVKDADLKINKKSVSLWVDILIDDSGQFSVTRLQQFIFTIAYTMIFISSFFSHKMNYPDFGEEGYPYILMGISAGTYLIGKGLKK